MGEGGFQSEKIFWVVGGMGLVVSPVPKGEGPFDSAPGRLGGTVDLMRLF